MMSEWIRKLEIGLAEAMRYLPVSWTSGIGAKLGEITVRKAEKNNDPWIKRFYMNAEQLCGARSINDQRALLLAYGRQVGRVYAEYTILQKMNHQGLIEVIGEEHLQNTSKPVLFTSPHMANWEVVFKILSEQKESACVLYEPRESKARMEIANRARVAWSKKICLASTSEPMVMRKLDKFLSEKTNLYILADEEKAGFVSAPSLGRDLPYVGNRWMLSRLAAKHGVDVIPVYVERTASTSFKIHIDEKISPNPSLDRTKAAKQIADQIDEKFDAWVRRQPEHWYWLPHFDSNAIHVSQQT